MTTFPAPFVNPKEAELFLIPADVTMRNESFDITAAAIRRDAVGYLVPVDPQIAILQGSP